MFLFYFFLFFYFLLENRNEYRHVTGRHSYTPGVYIKSNGINIALVGLT